MNRSFVFSLCAITPLLLSSEFIDTMVHQENVHLHENLDDTCEELEDLLSSYTDETQKANEQPTEQEQISLDTILFEPEKSPPKLADVQTQPPYDTVLLEDATTCQTDMCLPDIQPCQVNARHTESGGIGYKHGYTTLQALLTYTQDRFIPFLDLRGHAFDDGRLAANCGIGTRYVINPSNLMVGINSYYDYRSLKHAHFNQWGLGLEGFYDRWELRLNGYLPVGKKRIVADHDLNWISFKRFSGNNILINENYTDKIISAKKGFNLEVAVHPFKIMRAYDCVVAAGPYYFGGEGKSAWGGKLRIKAEVAKYLFVELSDSYDRVYHNRFQGTLMLSLPFGGKKCAQKKTSPTTAESCFADNVMLWRGVQPVERQEIIVAKRETKTYTVDPIAIDPITKQPIQVTFVQNNSGGSNIGTFENPFTALASVPANTGNIYIFPGNGLTTNLDTGWILQNNQRFLGSAAAHTFQTTKGVLTVPIQTALFPMITNSSGPIALNTPVGGASNFEVAGVLVFSPGVGGTCMALGGRDFIIRNNIVNGNGTAGGIALQVTGDILIDSNVVQGAGGGGGSGVAVGKDGTFNLSSTLNVTITNNQINSNSLSNVVIQPQTGATGMQNLTITGNTLTNGGVVGLYIINNSNPNLFTNGTINSNQFIDNGFNFHEQSLVNGIMESFQVYDNIILDSHTGAIGIGFEVNGNGTQLCLNLHDNLCNLSNGGLSYHLMNSGGAATPPSTFTVEPLINNIGGLTVTSGTITLGPTCACKFCTLPND